MDEEEDRIWQTIHQLSLAPLQISPILQNLDFVSRKVMVMVKVMVFKTFEGALRLAAGAFFFLGKTRFLEKSNILKLRKISFYEKMSFFIKNSTFELLGHHHELNQKKLILLNFFMFKIDSAMLKL